MYGWPGASYILPASGGKVPRSLTAWSLHSNAEGEYTHAYVYIYLTVHTPMYFGASEWCKKKYETHYGEEHGQK